MIAYNEHSLDRLVINDEAAKARNKRLISVEEFTAISGAYKPDLYSPNMFIRIGLFIMTAVIALMSYGLVFLITGSALDNETTLFVMTLMFGAFIYIVLEWMIRSKRHYRSGVDDALLWLSFTYITADIAIYFDFSELSTSLLIFSLSAAALIRFANSVMSAVMFCSFLAAIFYSITTAGASGRAMLPFALMLISIAIYILVTKLKDQSAVRHYRYCFMMLEVLSLIAIYCSVNYFIVRELSIQMFNLQIATGASITGGWFFWLCTFMLPIIYVARGLQTKDHVILRTGLLLVAATVLTFRYYYHIAPVEQILTVAGIILIAIAYAVIRYLQTERRGITDAASEKQIEEGLQVESLVIAETFKEVPAPQEGFSFGGGSTGGGGATGQY
jgi:hypothetical protein